MGDPVKLLFPVLVILALCATPALGQDSTHVPVAIDYSMWPRPIVSPNPDNSLSISMYLGLADSTMIYEFRDDKGVIKYAYSLRHTDCKYGVPVNNMMLFFPSTCDTFVKIDDHVRDVIRKYQQMLEDRANSHKISTTL
jgi:hypothetical protein